jgi:hypothetical protein
MCAFAAMPSRHMLKNTTAPEHCVPSLQLSVEFLIERWQSVENLGHLTSATRWAASWPRALGHLVSDVLDSPPHRQLSRRNVVTDSFHSPRHGQCDFSSSVACADDQPRRMVLRR